MKCTNWIFLKNASWSLAQAIPVFLWVELGSTQSGGVTQKIFTFQLKVHPTLRTQCCHFNFGVVFRSYWHILCFYWGKVMSMSINVFNLNLRCPDTFSAHIRSETPPPPSTHQLSHQTHTHTLIESPLLRCSVCSMFPCFSPSLQCEHLQHSKQLNSVPAHRLCRYRGRYRGSW